VKIYNWVICGLVFIVGSLFIAGPEIVSGGATEEKPPRTQDIQPKGTSYAPVDLKEDFAAVMARMKAAKAAVLKRQMDLLHQRYDLANRPAKDVTMSGGKPILSGWIFPASSSQPP
jgi:hypothetical protein